MNHKLFTPQAPAEDFFVQGLDLRNDEFRRKTCVIIRKKL